MARRMNRLIRSVAPSAALLILLAQGPRLRKRGGKPRAPPSAGRMRSTLLKDADYFPALLEGIRHARQEIALSVFFFKTMGTGNSQPNWS